jgi:asparagine synthase (glutamine-hydrolysing)
VRDHLIADVPVGLFLSAGLDSAAVAALAARHSKAVRAFTVGFADQPDFDELRVAAETARRLGLPHTALQVPAHEAEQAALEWLAAADQPSMDGLNVFLISKAVRAHGIKVALCGLGADELFGGYSSFREVPTLRRLTWAVGWLPCAARRGLAGALAVRKPAAVRHKLADMLGGTGGVATLALQRRRVLGDRQLAALGLEPDRLGLSPNFLPPEAERWLPPPDADPGWAIAVVESRFYQTNVLLRDGDANGMAHALEIRVPFLAQGLLEWLHRLPGSVRFPPGRPPKHLLRAAVADLLYPELLDRPKTGFMLPLRRWMAGPLRPLCEEGLAILKGSGLLRPGGVDAIWAEFLSHPESQAWSRALSLCVLGDYLRRHAG